MKSPFRLFALTFGGPDAASTQYRLLQYSNSFATNGIDFAFESARQFDNWKSLAKYDAVILQKTLLTKSKVRLIRQYSRRFFYDVDDLIWLSPTKINSWFTRLRIENRLRFITKTVDNCTVANQVIAGDLHARGASPLVVPMSLSGDKWKYQQKSTSPITIGWSGAPKNLQFLQQILPALQTIQKKFPAVRFAFHCGQDPKFEDLHYEYLPYIPNEEPEAVNKFHIGLLPLLDEPFTRGKSPIKSLQYFACGVAVVGSPIGATQEILRDGENALYARTLTDWTEALSRLILDADFRIKIAKAGLSDFSTTYETNKVFKCFYDVIVS